MLTLKTMLKMWGKGCGASLDVALDRHDNANHRRNYSPCYQPKPGERSVQVKLRYEFGPDGDMRIVQD